MERLREDFHQKGKINYISKINFHGVFKDTEAF